MKKILVFALTVAMLLSLAVIGTSAAADEWDGTTATSFASGTGTEADPYVIATAEELAYLAAQVKAGTTYEGQYFVLNSDIDLKKTEWTPIGVYMGKDKPENVAFAGSFDGKGHTVSGISITSDANSLYCGLFGYVCTKGYLKNLVIADSSVNTGTAKSRYAGSVAGKLEAAEVSSLVAKADVTVSSAGSAGGVCGRIVGAKAEYLINHATVTTSAAESSAFGGGICGALGGTATLEYAVNYGHVSGEGAFHGGITGITGGDEGPGALSNCVNYGNVDYTGAKGWYVGGIAGCFGHTAGHNYTGTNCYNFGTVTFPETNTKEVAIGEIIGEARKGTIQITDCYSVDLEGINSVGKESVTPTLTNVATKTVDELNTLADAVVATVNANIVVPSEPVAPETTEPAPETTAAPETTEPGASGQNR